jgi:hypothetical protein
VFAIGENPDFNDPESGFVSAGQRPREPIVTEEGVKVNPLEEEGIRKLQGGATVRGPDAPGEEAAVDAANVADIDVGPKPTGGPFTRTKDVVDASAIFRSLAREDPGLNPFRARRQARIGRRIREFETEFEPERAAATEPDPDIPLPSERDVSPRIGIGQRGQVDFNQIARRARRDNDDTGRIRFDDDDVDVDESATIRPRSRDSDARSPAGSLAALEDATALTSASPGASGRGDVTNSAPTSPVSGSDSPDPVSFGGGSFGGASSGGASPSGGSPGGSIGGGSLGGGSPGGGSPGGGSPGGGSLGGGSPGGGSPGGRSPGGGSPSGGSPGGGAPRDIPETIVPGGDDTREPDLDRDDDDERREFDNELADFTREFKFNVDKIQAIEDIEADVGVSGEGQDAFNAPTDNLDDL